MELWTCDCLNVKICTRHMEASQADVTQLGVNPSSHEIFNGGVAEVLLDLEGIKVEHPSLLRQEKAENWIVQRCCNCQQYTHASRASQAGNTVLVSLHLKNNPSEIEALSSRPEYSNIYKIILRSRDENKFFRQDSEAQGAVEMTLREVRQRLSAFLMEEEEAMETRVRDYEESQRSAFEELQNKARREKGAIEEVIVKAAMEKGNNRLNKTQDDSDMVDSLHMPLDHRLSRSKKMSRGKKISQLSQSLQPRTVPDEMQDDVLFDLDGFQEDEDHPFYESEGEDTDGSSLGDDGSVPQVAAGIYSSSVPISVPMWPASGGDLGSSRRRRDTLEEEEEDEAPQAEDIAASIKALARSVHVDGTEIFGELPQSRRRINMSDIGM